VQRIEDGRAFLNLGSSARTAPGWNNVDFSWLVRLSKYRRVSFLLHQIGILSDFRYQRLLCIDPNAILWDLRKGVPFPEKTFDGVYHSHVLEHVDRELAGAFLTECHRVLKPGGTLRIVVPDLETLVRNYLAVIDRIPTAASIEELRFATEEIFDQMVRRIPKARSEASRFLKFLETILIGNTSRAGILHRWMYDRFSLAFLLEDVGFRGIQRHTPQSSSICGWSDFHLDTDPDGTVYKHTSLYMEATRP
jgi:SAM-dependent methyltransferase